MCTLTVIPLFDEGADIVGFRLVTNRDEARWRPAAEPPILQPAGPRAAIWPVDPFAGGTWIGANDAGLVLSILNGNPHPPPKLPPRSELTSRGHIIPVLLEEATAEAAFARFEREFDIEAFAPFRLVAADFSGVRSAVWDRARYHNHAAPRPSACYVSSGLGDHLVAPRLDLFAGFFRDSDAPTPDEQDAFHDHRWPDKPELSVRMSRPDARTVSRTTVEVVSSGPAPSMALTYRDDHAESRCVLCADDNPQLAAAERDERC